MSQYRAKLYSLADDKQWSDLGTGYVGTQKRELIFSTDQDMNQITYSLPLDTKLSFVQDNEKRILWIDPRNQTQYSLSFLLPKGRDEILQNIDHICALSRPIQLPIPNAGNLQEIQAIINQNRNPFDRCQILCGRIMRESFFSALLSLREELDENVPSNIETFFQLSSLVATLFNLSEAMTEFLLRDDLSLRVIRCLEFDRQLHRHIKHSEFLSQTPMLHNPLRIRDDHLNSLLTQNYRAGYIKDTVLPYQIDELATLRLARLIERNNAGIAHTFLDNTRLCEELFEIAVQEMSEEEKMEWKQREDTVNTVDEFEHQRRAEETELSVLIECAPTPPYTQESPSDRDAVDPANEPEPVMDIIPPVPSVCPPSSIPLTQIISPLDYPQSTQRSDSLKSILTLLRTIRTLPLSEQNLYLRLFYTSPKIPPMASVSHFAQMMMDSVTHSFQSFQPLITTDTAGAKIEIMDVLNTNLRHTSREIRIVAIDLLNEVFLFNRQNLRLSILKEQPTYSFFHLLVNAIISEPDPSLRIALFAQLHDLLLPPTDDALRLVRVFFDNQIRAQPTLASQLFADLNNITITNPKSLVPSHSNASSTSSADFTDILRSSIAQPPQPKPASPTAPPAAMVSSLCELGSFLLTAYHHQAMPFFARYSIPQKVLALLHHPSKFPAVSACNFLRAFLTHSKHEDESGLMRAGFVTHIFSALLNQKKRTNLVSSSIVELINFITTNDKKQRMRKYIVEKYLNEIKPLDAAEKKMMERILGIDLIASQLGEMTVKVKEERQGRSSHSRSRSRQSKSTSRSRSRSPASMYSNGSYGLFGKDVADRVRRDAFVSNGLSNEEIILIQNELKHVDDEEEKMEEVWDKNFDDEKNDQEQLGKGGEWTYLDSSFQDDLALLDDGEKDEKEPSLQRETMDDDHDIARFFAEKVDEEEEEYGSIFTAHDGHNEIQHSDETNITPTFPRTLAFSNELTPLPGHPTSRRAIFITNPLESIDEEKQEETSRIEDEREMEGSEISAEEETKVKIDEVDFRKKKRGEDEIEFELYNANHKPDKRMQISPLSIVVPQFPPLSPKQSGYIHHSPLTPPSPKATLLSSTVLPSSPTLVSDVPLSHLNVEDIGLMTPTKGHHSPSLFPSSLHPSTTTTSFLHSPHSPQTGLLHSSSSPIANRNSPLLHRLSSPHKAGHVQSAGQMAFALNPLIAQTSNATATPPHSPKRRNSTDSEQ